MDVAQAKVRACNAIPLAGRRVRCAFTLLEVMIVVVVMSILAISVAPALSSAKGAQGLGATKEVERMLLMARAKAMASSVPHAVRFDTTPSSLQLCWRNPDSGAREGAVGSDGMACSPQLLSARFGNIHITNVEIDGYSGSPGYVWFAFDGLPELRDSSAVRQGTATRDAVITLSDGGKVYVTAGTGSVRVVYGGTP